MITRYNNNDEYTDDDATILNEDPIHVFKCRHKRNKLGLFVFIGDVLKTFFLILVSV